MKQFLSFVQWQQDVAGAVKKSVLHGRSPGFLVLSFWDERPSPDTPRASWWIGEANGGSHWSRGKPFQNLSGYHFHCLRVPGYRERKQVTADLENGHGFCDQRISLGVSHTCLVGGFK